VNDFGVGASTNAPYFCKTHLLARFDIRPAAELDLTKDYERAVDALWPPPTTTIGPKGVSGASFLTLLIDTVLINTALYICSDIR
jgi:hypothetical protein